LVVSTALSVGEDMVGDCGLTESYRRVRVFDAEFPFPAASVATPAVTETPTSPCPVGTTAISRVNPLPVNEAIEPWTTVTSEDVKPSGSSVKVIVNGIGDVRVGDVALLETVVAGEVVSYMTES
jgi:hypothetical protein